MDKKHDTILLVEDNALNQQMLSRRLEKKGFVVMAREDGVELMAAVKEMKPDLILMDIQLPQIDGLTLARELKQDPSTAAIPLIAVTAFAMRGDREKCLGAGYDAYISKPVDFPRLIGVIQTLLEAFRPQEKLRKRQSSAFHTRLLI